MNALLNMLKKIFLSMRMKKRVIQLLLLKQREYFEKQYGHKKMKKCLQLKI